ncbi:hypothetical protein VUR80DRAFT_7990 [Thermomyces stellatus]
MLTRSGSLIWEFVENGSMQKPMIFPQSRRSPSTPTPTARLRKPSGIRVSIFISLKDESRCALRNTGRFGLDNGDFAAHAWRTAGAVRIRSRNFAPIPTSQLSDNGINVCSLFSIEKVPYRAGVYTFLHYASALPICKLHQFRLPSSLVAEEPGVRLENAHQLKSYPRERDHSESGALVKNRSGCKWHCYHFKVLKTAHRAALHAHFILWSKS